MLKNYFTELGNVFKFSALFFAKNFVKQNLIIWLLILLQIVLAIPLLYFSKEMGFSNFSLLWKIFSVAGLALFIVLFFFMFKKVFDLASLGVEKDKLSNFKIVKALLILGVVNCIPFLAFLLFYLLAQVVPVLGQTLVVALKIFTYFFYFATSLSLVAIVKWQDKNVIVAVLKSVKFFFKKLGTVIPVMFFFFVIASLLVFLICTSIYAVAIYFKFINESFIDATQAIVNVYSLYIVAGMYIGAQIKLLEGSDE